MRVCAIAAVCLAAAMLAQPALGWQQYSVINLGAFTAADSHANDINASGVAAGSYNEPDGYSRGAIWSGGGMTTIGTLGGLSSGGSAINDSGVVAGTSRDAANSIRAYIYRSGQLETLQTLGTGSTRAYGINNAAQVVGSVTTGSGQMHAALWTDGAVSDLGVIYGNYSEAYAINERGWIVGSSSISDGGSSYAHAFIYKNGAMNALDSQLDLSRTTRSTALGVNYAGTAVGSSTYGGVMSACWWKNGAIGYLGTLGGNSQARSINNLDQVVGYSVLTNGEYRACLWQNGQMIDLNTLMSPGSGLTLSMAYGINDSGQIVGSALANGAYRAFLLTPVPEPSSVLALLSGVAGIGGVTLRRRR